MKNFKLLMIPILLCVGMIKSFGQDVEIPFSWVSTTPTNSSSIGLFQCGSMNITLNTGDQHNLFGTGALIPSGMFSTEVPITLTFSKPVCNLSILVIDLDEGEEAPSEWIDFDIPLPVGVSPSVAGFPFTYSGGVADPNGVEDTEAWVNWNAPLSTVSFEYNRTIPASYALILDSLRFDCDCTVPTDLNCCYGNGWQSLTWDEVAGVEGYEIEFGFNDASSGCCDSVTGPPAGWIETVTDNVFNVPDSFEDCFWWRVRSVLTDGTKSEWSEKMCDCLEEEVTCIAPINLDCQIESSAGTRTISWDPVAGAVGYVVSITYNDPACCLPVPDPIETVVITTSDTYVAGIDPNKCFSWKVRTVCTNDPTYSDWSETKCSSDCYFPEAIPIPGRLKILDGGKVGASDLQIELVPNPADEYVTITAIENGDARSTNTTLSIVNITGIEVYNDVITVGTPKRVELKNLNPGIYLCQIVSGDDVLSSTRLVVH